MFTLRNILSSVHLKRIRKKIRKLYNGPIWFEMKSNQRDILVDSLGNNDNKCAYLVRISYESLVKGVFWRLYYWVYLIFMGIVWIWIQSLETKVVRT